MKQFILPFLIFSGAGGIGKSTALKHLSLAWANGQSTELQKFDFVFHIALNSAKANQTVEEMIVEQHRVLQRHGATPLEISRLLTGDTMQNVCLLLDGYDEYQKGTSTDVDNVLVGVRLPHSSVLLTSRDTDKLVELRPYMNVEAEIMGFDPERVEEYISLHLESDRKTKELVALATKKNLIKEHDRNVDFGFMQIPIFLHMICVLFQRAVSLPKTRTGVLYAIVARCPDWEEIRKSGKKTANEWKAALYAALIKLGTLAWERLRERNKDLVFRTAFKLVLVVFSPMWCSSVFVQSSCF